jgi:hypothetical protein
MIRPEVLDAFKRDDVVISPLKSKLADDVISACPVLSEKGYKVIDVPENIFHEIYRRTIRAYFLQGNVLTEKDAQHAIPNTYGVAPEICYLDDNFFTQVHNDPDFINLHSEFAGIELKPSFFFGPRIYHRGDILKEHIDHPSTHIIGSSINIFCEGNPDWPLVFRVGNQYEEVVIKQGEMVIFEAVRVPHSRPIPFSGERYFGVFYHFEPKEPSKVLSNQYFDAANLYEEAMKQR